MNRPVSTVTVTKTGRRWWNTAPRNTVVDKAFGVRHMIIGDLGEGDFFDFLEGAAPEHNTFLWVVTCVNTDVSPPEVIARRLDDGGCGRRFHAAELDWRARRWSVVKIEALKPVDMIQD